MIFQHTSEIIRKLMEKADLKLTTTEESTGKEIIYEVIATIEVRRNPLMVLVGK
jgi:hypothetical protein